MLVFSNKGQMDPRLITTMGVNVKENESPVGAFGTGLKYAIAITLCLKGSIAILTGHKAYYFHTDLQTIRGKEFSFITMQEGEQRPISTLGFTTDLGKAWAPWMAYRELRANCQDEGGEVQERDKLPQLDPDMTYICVACPEIESAHKKSSTFWLAGEPLWSGHGVSVFPGRSPDLFYRGVRATVTSKPKEEAFYKFHYSITQAMDLTEDRTLADMWTAKRRISEAIVQCDNKEIVEAALSDYNLDFDVYTVPSAEFVRRVLDNIANKRIMTTGARDLVTRHCEDDVKKAEIAIMVPEAWTDMVLQVPTAAPQRHASIYDYTSAVEARIEGLEKELAYWRACAQKLAGRLG